MLQSQPASPVVVTSDAKVGTQHRRGEGNEPTPAAGWPRLGPVEWTNRPGLLTLAAKDWMTRAKSNGEGEKDS
jgi:hypothetical protein